MPKWPDNAQISWSFEWKSMNRWNQWLETNFILQWYTVCADCQKWVSIMERGHSPLQNEDIFISSKFWRFLYLSFAGNILHYFIRNIYLCFFGCYCLLGNILLKRLWLIPQLFMVDVFFVPSYPFLAKLIVVHWLTGFQK